MARILLACGGTGGHFYPGLAAGLLLKERGHEPLFLLRKGDPAFKTLEGLYLPSAEADLSGLPRKLVYNWPAWAKRNWGGFSTVRNILRSWQPQVVAGMGAYLTFPAAFFAWRRGIPVLLHESNAQFGLANDLARPLADKVCLGLPNAKAGKAAVWTGTPVRPGFAALPEQKAARKALGLEPGKATLLVFGGSQGAEALNRLVLEAVRRLDGRQTGRLQVLLLTGRAHYDKFKTLVEGLPVQARPYLEEMEQAYAAADLVLCRSGASTVAELCCAKKPAYLVPFPFATGRHQSANAKVLAQAGAALYKEEAELTAEGLEKDLEAVILMGEGRLKDMARAYGSLPDPSQAASRLADEIEKLA